MLKIYTTPLKVKSPVINIVCFNFYHCLSILIKEIWQIYLQKQEEYILIFTISAFSESLPENSDKCTL